jgi:signal peptidase II
MMVRAGLLFVVLGLAVALDLGTKAWAEASLTLHQPYAVLGEALRFTLGYNRGVAFGLLAGAGFVPLLASGAIIVGLLAWTLRRTLQPDASTVQTLLLGLVIGGALGNFLDRLRDGIVTDFLDLGLGALRWPTFNLADAFIVGSLLVLFLASAAKRRTVAEADT